MHDEQLCGLTVEEIFRFIAPHGFDRHHSIKIATAIYRKRNKTLNEINNIPKALKEFLSQNFTVGIYSPVASETSEDGTVKYMFSTPDNKKIETVYLPDKRRKTVCVSTQAGCRMGCPFCLTGKYGYYGDLTAGDMINQIISLPDVSEITHVVFMGMGEPMDNVEEVIKACNIITSEWGLSLSSRNVTVSTVGLTPGIREFLERSDCNLTLSLHSPFSDERKEVIPVEHKYPVHTIIDIMKTAPPGKKRRMSLAYIMIRDVNDTDRHLEALKELLVGSSIRVNLLPYHKVSDDMNRSSTEERMQFFKHNLVISGISASVRKSRGEDISAACGLLASGWKRGQNDLLK
jgi:23S rRNA (adenine2503-C2)-methyltransferase